MEPIRQADEPVIFEASPDETPMSWLRELTEENERLRRENAAIADRMARLQAVAAGLARVVTVREVVETVVGEGIRAFNAVNGIVYLATADGRHLESPYSVGMRPDAVRKFSRLDVDLDTPPTQSYRERRTIITVSKNEARTLYPALGEATQNSIAHAWISMPILSGDSALGAIVFGFSDGGITDADEALAAALAQQCAVALERARLFEAERQARAQADEANRAKMDFLAVMSHELRTPLNAIGGYAQLLEMGIHGPATPQQLDAVARIQRSQQHLLRLINDVLSFAKIDAGHLEMAIRDVRVQDLLASLDPLIRPQLVQRSLSFRCETVDPSVTMYADADKTQQILLNLLSNAGKFTEPGGAITVSVTVAEDTVDIAVGDTGRGIPSEKLEAIFEPFVQVDASKTRSNEGTGLGLAISRDLARAMNGGIEVESELGRGSVFTLTLPRGR